MIFSIELIEEFIEVASRPKFSRFFSEKDIKNLLEYFDNYGRLVEVMSSTKVCRDPKDNFLLNLAIDSKADYLITGDDDLLIHISSDIQFIANSMSSRVDIREYSLLKSG